MKRLLVLPIEPVAKGRPRFGNGRTYTPGTTVRFENIVRMLASAIVKKQIRGPVEFEVWFFLKRPKRPKHPLYPASKPDWDNLGKAVSDALNEIAYLDDCQVVDAHVYKRYAVGGTEPRIEFSVRDLDEQTIGSDPSQLDLERDYLGKDNP